MRQPKWYWLLELVGGPYDGQLVTVTPNDLGMRYETPTGDHVYIRNNYIIGNGCPFMEYCGFEPVEVTP